MNKSLRIILIIALFFLLILVRSFASVIFYDPFINFFKNDYLTSIFPEFITGNLFTNLFFRNSINTLISLAIIYLFFQKKQLIAFSVKFYIVTFIVLSIVYLVLLKTEFSSGYLLAFYVRRMLIHPIFLLILLPAFYYQKKSSQ
ncbi:MAG: exosortase F system-associated protein [Flavobacteriaceae bacterium]|nr:exosortase F system-associated protein [Flavobacteriaceae bacterium]